MQIILTDQNNNEMNKVIYTSFKCICGSSESGKTHLLLNMLTSPRYSSGVFWPRFEKIILYYRHWQTIYDQFSQEIPGKVFFKSVTQPEVGTGDAKNTAQRCEASLEKRNQARLDSLISNLLDHESQESEFYTLLGNKKALAIFDDSCEEILQSSSFANLATAGRHRGVSVIFIKHNLYQQGKFCVTVDKNTTHLIILKSPRIGRQLRLLGSELEFADPTFLQDAYQSATSVPHGHLMIDLSTECHDALRFCTRVYSGNYDTNLSLQTNDKVKKTDFSKSESPSSITKRKFGKDGRVSCNRNIVKPTG